MNLTLSGLESNQKLSITLEENISVPQEYGLVDSLPLVKLSGTVQKSGDEFLLEGTLKSTVSLPCGKCLSSVDVLVCSSVFERLSAQSSDEDEEIWHVKSLADVDITPLILLNLQLNIPMNVFCSENCKGICRYCGKNLNIESCKCHELNREIDPRLEKLKDLLG